MSLWILPTNTSVTVWNTTTSVLNADAGREYVWIQNDSDEDIYIAFWADAVMNKWLLYIYIILHSTHFRYIWYPMFKVIRIQW